MTRLFAPHRPDPLRRGAIVTLPPDAGSDYEIYVNGVLQTVYLDYEQDGRDLIFYRRLRKDTVDVRYEVGGRPLLARGLPITVCEGEATAP